MAKQKSGRPAKINEVWLEVAKEAVKDPMNVVAFTDKEFLEYVNEGVEERLGKQKKSITKKEVWKHQVHQRTFEEYKSGKELKNKKANKLLDEFSRVYKKAIKQQKRNLLDKLSKESKARQRYAWILERKFEDWNLKRITENKTEIVGKD